MPTNPIGDQVAERLYEFVRTRDMNADYKSSIRPSPWVALSDDLRTSWRRQAEQLIHPMLAAAAEAYSHSGLQIDHDLLDPVTANEAENVQAGFKAHRTAWRASRDENVPYPKASVASGLAAFAALRAAFGWSPTLTAPEIVDSMREFEQQTPAGDAVRLHLAAAHDHPIGLGAGDGEAEQTHQEMHNRGEGWYSHHPTSGEWSTDEIEDAISRQSEKGIFRAAFDRLLSEHTDRAPHTPDFDKLRLHLMSHHGVINAFELRDYQVDELHTHDHNGPGYGTRSHLASNHNWSSKRIKKMVAELDETDPGQNGAKQQWAWDGYERTVSRLEQWTR